MKINIKATGMELTPAISDYVNKRVSSLEKYLSDDNPDIVVQVEVGRTTQHHKGGDVYKAELHLTGAGMNHYATLDKEDIYAAIDGVKDEMGKELRRAKGRRMMLIRRGGKLIKGMMKGFYDAGAKGMKRLGFKGKEKDIYDDEL